MQSGAKLSWYRHKLPSWHSSHCDAPCDHQPVIQTVMANSKAKQTNETTAELGSLPHQTTMRTTADMTRWQVLESFLGWTDGLHLIRQLL